MLDVVVTCYPHGPTISSFPQVRGYYLAEHLSRTGVRAAFRQLPLPGLECEVVICSGYQAEMEWFDRHLAEPLSAINAKRWYCLVATSLHDLPHHFSREYCEWFAARGGVLCHLAPDGLEPYEHWIGLGVDGDVVPLGTVRRDVLFDFPRSGRDDAAVGFDTRVVDAIHAVLPDVRVVGSGPPDTAIREAFDHWIDYGQPHGAYAAAAFPTCFALVAGWYESMGLAIAEAQVAGACVVYSDQQVRDGMLVEGGGVRYEAGDIASLVRALAAARERDGAAIRRAALERFDFGAVAERTLHAIGLEAPIR